MINCISTSLISGGQIEMRLRIAGIHGDGLSGVPETGEN